jgi:hypothetical protein
MTPRKMPECTRNATAGSKHYSAPTKPSRDDRRDHARENECDENTVMCPACRVIRVTQESR